MRGLVFQGLALPSARVPAMLGQTDEGDTMTRFTLALAAAALLAACSTTSSDEVAAVEAKPAAVPTATATAALEPAPVATADATETTDPDKQICKRTKVTGSNFKRKVCGTAADWARMEAESRKATEQIQRVKGPGTNN